MSRIFWTEEENELIHAEAIRLVQEGEADVLPYEIVRKAQKVLPKDRQREIKGHSSVSSELRTRLAVLSKVRAAYLLGVQERTASTPIEAPQPVSVIQQPQPKSLVDLFADLMAAVLKHPSVQEAARQFAAEVITASLTQHSSGDPPRLHAAERVAAVAKLPVVLMLGFKPDQRAPFERRYAEAIRFKWWYDGEGTPNQLEDKARAADAVMCAVEACSHQTIQHAIRVNSVVKRVTGGSSSMMRELDFWLEKCANGKP